MSGFAAKNMAVFIDADNLSNATALDHVFAELQSRAERISYRRAYGRPESLKAIEAVLWRHGVRPVSNLVTSKVTTDIALTIDAVESVCRRGFDTVVICSGDADFVPLATWLREQGCSVLCFSLNSILFANPESFYDEVVMLEVVEKPEPPAGPELPLVPAPTPAVAPLPAVSPEIPPKPAFTPAPVAAPAFLVPMPSLPPAPSPSHQNAGTVQQVLQAFPALRSGEPQHLSQVVTALRQQGVLDPGIKFKKWFACCSSEFELLPQSVPNQIRYRRSPSAAPLKVPEIAGLARQTPALPEEVERILQAVPALREAPQLLSQVVPVLRQKTILGKTTKSTTFFARHAAHFKLSPAHQPTQLTFVPVRAVPVQPIHSLGAQASARVQQSVPLAVLSWPVTASRRAAPALLSELHGLRSVLVQLALCRVTAADVLLTVPELVHGQPCALSAVASRLRERGLLRSSDSALRILERYPRSFAVEMGRTPQTVRYLP